ncbi:MAG: histidine kinase [Polyangiales bacterium]
MQRAHTERDFGTYQRETVRYLLERQAGVFALMLSFSLALDAIRLHPSREFATILQRLPFQIAMCALVWVLLRYTRFGARWPTALGGAAYTTIAGFGGLLLGDLGGFEGPFFYSAYVLPTFVMMLPCALLERLVITLVMVVAFMLAFFAPHPEHLDYPLAHIAFSYLLVIMVADLYFGHRAMLLLRERFAMEQQLEQHSAALAQDNQQLEERVRHQAGAVRSLLDRVETTQHEARTALARDLHDGMGQLVAGTRLELHHIERALDTGEELSTENLGYLYGLVDRLDRQVRDMVRELRDPSRFGSLELALGKLKDAYDRMPGVHIALHLDAEREPDELVCEAMVAIAREALTNAIKHGQARHVDIRVFLAEGDTWLAVEDDGLGLSGDGTRRSGPGGFGVVGMRERAEALGGTFGLDPGKAASDGAVRGARVWARFPGA